MMRKIIFEGQGLTLIELMIVLALSLLLMGAVFLAHQAQSKSGRVQEQVVTMQQDLRAVMDIIEKDVRNSGCNPSGASVAAFVAASSGPAAIGINSDLDGDGLCTKENESLVYQLNGSSLRRDDVVHGVEVLAQNISQFSVRYFDEENTVIVPAPTLSTSQAESVLYVEVSMTSQSEGIDPDTGSRLTRSLTREINSRNRQIQFNP